MEHPYMFFVNLFELIGLGSFAHHYPHVVYSWVIMIFLIVVGGMTVKGISMIPSKGQNFWEIAVDGMEEFMVDLTGNEGRWFFSAYRYSIFVYRRLQSFGADARFLSAYRQPQHHGFVCPGCGSVHSCDRRQVSRSFLY